MKIEHFALQVPDPARMAAWYASHLKLSVVRETDAPTYQRFLNDSSGSILLEFYRNPRVPVPDYATMDPLLLHIAFVSENPAADRDRLVNAGATLADELTVAPNGDSLVMLRDPWGVALQLVKRVEPILRKPAC